MPARSRTRKLLMHIPLLLPLHRNQMPLDLLELGGANERRGLLVRRNSLYAKNFYLNPTGGGWLGASRSYILRHIS